MTGIISLTADYETWLRSKIPLVEDDLVTKHTEMAASALRFLRGTYYCWLTRMTSLLPALLEAPRVPLVGDVHAENFGTWTDERGTRRWGVNDYDELGEGPYPIDLVRLATSCVLSPHVALDDATICDVLFETWASADPGHAVKVDEAGHLHHLLPESRSAAKYAAALAAGARVDDTAIPPEVRAAVAGTVEGRWQPHWHRRVAGTGSLGHPRFVGVDHSTAREVKLLGPPSAAWVAVAACQPDAGLYERVRGAVRGPRHAARVQGWQLRELAPDVARIDITALRPHSTERVLRSMAHALVDVHGVDSASLAAAREDARRRDKHWLRDAVAAMTADTRAAFDEWRAAKTT